MTETAAAIQAGDVTDDAFLGGGLEILQPRSGYRAGLDAVMLAAAVSNASGRPLRVLDIGAGVGTAGLCVARRLEQAEVVLLERNPQLSALAAENIRRNNLENRARAVTAAVGASAADIRAAGLVEESFDCVIANPPYHDRGAGTLATDEFKATSHAMAEDELERWARFMARMAAPRGTALMVHKAEALDRVLAAFETRFGAIRILPLYPRAGAPAHRVIIEGKKGSRALLQLLSGFVLHLDGNEFTPAAQAILKGGAGLSFGGGPP